ERRSHRSRARAAAVIEAEAHAAAREGAPDFCLIGAAGEIDIGLQDRVARLRDRRIHRLKLHAIEHQLPRELVPGMSRAGGGGVAGVKVWIESVLLLE